MWKAPATRCVLAFLLTVTALHSSGSQTLSVTQRLPVVSILLPANVPSGSVQIFYFMVGTFGGYGGQTTQQTNLHSYELPTSVDDKPASEIKIIAYAPGCEIQTYVIPLEGESKVERDFVCQPPRSVTLSGQIVPSELIKNNNAELVVTYLAFWSDEFFGIKDGPVVELQLAILSPDPDGNFQVNLPNFSFDHAPPSSGPRSSLKLWLSDPKTWDPIVFDLAPEPSDYMSEDHNLKIQSHYPNGLRFNSASSRGAPDVSPD